MKVLLDVDGVVADFLGAVLEAVGSNRPPESFDKWDFLDELPQGEKEKAEETLQDPDFWSSLPLMDGAKKGVQQIRDMGHTITWVTSPWDSCPGWANVRRDWVHRHFGPGEVIVTKDKEKVDGDILIDDKPSNVEKWIKAHPDKKVLVFDAPYNRDMAYPRLDWKWPLKHL